ncbi:MAG: TonB-dependent receptor domain-containing protein [Janthinobacterium lividum]
MLPRIPRTALLLTISLAGTALRGYGQQLPAPAVAPAQAAGRLTGTGTDGATGKPIAYASVAVLNAAGSPVSGGVGGSDGSFVLVGIAPGTYTVRVSFLGYQEFTREGVVVPAGGTVALGAVPLLATAQKLGEVVVTAQQPLIEEKVDRTVYNAENDQTTRGGDATDVLKRVPLLSVDLDGNVSVRGSQNIKVLINNKPSTITANSVADGLRQLPADQIKRVEVITSPSAKYDAEGSGGIINIVTKGNTLRGGQLSLDGSGGTRSGTLNLNGGYRTGKMGFALGGFGRAGYNTPGSFTNEQLTTNPTTGIQTQTTQAADTRQNQLFGRYTLGWDYDLNKQNSLAASLTYGTRNATNYQDALATITQRPGITGPPGTSLRNVKTTDDSGTVDASLTYTHTYEVEQRELSVLALFSRNNRTYNFNNDIYAATDVAGTGISGNDNASANQEVTAQLDYQTPTAKNQLLEFGVKDIKRTVDSDYSYYGQLANSQANNSFHYDQNVAAGYVAYTLSLPQGFTLKPGVRYEYTAITADFGTGAVADIPAYSVLVPSVNVLRKLGNGNVVKLAYNRRLQRPSLQFLNPNLQAANPLIQTIGNPLLRPEYTNNYELSFSTLLKQANLNFSAFMRNTTGSIQSVRTPLDDASYPGAVLIGYQNVGQENAYGGSAFASLDVGSKFSLSGGVDLYYAVLRNNVADPRYAARNAGFVVGGRLYGSYALPKGWSLQVFGFYRGQQVQLQGTQSSFALYSMSLKHDFAEKKGSLGFGAENFFSPSNTIRSTISSPLLAQQSFMVQHITSFKVYLSYRVGKLTAEPRPHKNVKNDDLKTEENGGGNQGSGSAPAATRPAPVSPPKTSSPSARP